MGFFQDPGDEPGELPECLSTCHVEWSRPRGTRVANWEGRIEVMVPWRVTHMFIFFENPGFFHEITIWKFIIVNSSIFKVFSDVSTILQQQDLDFFICVTSKSMVKAIGSNKQP